jgi:hypothetical protein
MVADRRDHLDLNLLTEQRATQIIQMLARDEDLSAPLGSR